MMTCEPCPYCGKKSIKESGLECAECGKKWGKLNRDAPSFKQFMTGSVKIVIEDLFRRGNIDIEFTNNFSGDYGDISAHIPMSDAAALTLEQMYEMCVSNMSRPFGFDEYDPKWQSRIQNANNAKGE